ATIAFQFGNGGLYVNIRPIPSNFLFYGLADLDSEPFHRRGQSDNPMLHVKLNNAEDLIFKKVSDLLSTSIKKVEINGYLLSPENLSLVAQLLRGSLVRYLDMQYCRVDDSTVSSIIEIAGRARKISLDLS
ncbi:hypothetical protein PMAYCL1PPCAC_26451, partial [Pristionchus mayeri]